MRLLSAKTFIKEDITLMDLITDYSNLVYDLIIGVVPIRKSTG